MTGGVTVWTGNRSALSSEPGWKTARKESKLALPSIGLQGDVNGRPTCWHLAWFVSAHAWRILDMSTSGNPRRMGRRNSVAKKDRGAYPEALHLLIRGKLKSGALPRNGLRRVSAGPGNGESCVACSEIIAETQVVMEGIGEHLMVLRFHVACFSLWNASVQSAQEPSQEHSPPNGS